MSDDLNHLRYERAKRIIDRRAALAQATIRKIAEAPRKNYRPHMKYRV